MLRRLCINCSAVGGSSYACSSELVRDLRRFGTYGIHPTCIEPRSNQHGDVYGVSGDLIAGPGHATSQWIAHWYVANHPSPHGNEAMPGMESRAVLSGCP